MNSPLINKNHLIWIIAIPLILSIFNAFFLTILADWQDSDQHSFSKLFGVFFLAFSTISIVSITISFLVNLFTTPLLSLIFVQIAISIFIHYMFFSGIYMAIIIALLSLSLTYISLKAMGFFKHAT